MEEISKSSYDASVTFLYDISLRVLEKQIDTIDSLDNKVRGISGFTILTFGALATFLSAQKLSLTLLILLSLIAISFFVSLVASFLSFRITRQKYLFKGEHLVGFLEIGLEATMLKEQFLREVVKQHEYNETIINKKAAYVRLILWLTIINLWAVIIVLILKTTIT